MQHHTSRVLVRPTAWRTLATVAGVLLAASAGLAQEGSDGPVGPQTKVPAATPADRAGAWAKGPRLAYARRLHATTVLADGSLLMTGGLGTYNPDT